jgi:hypothetical protein
MMNLARSGVYRAPSLANGNDPMRRIDALFTTVLRARRIVRTLSEKGFPIDRKARAAADAPDGQRGVGAEAQDDQASAAAQDLSSCVT